MILLLDPRPDSDQHQHLTTSRGSSLVHAYHVWSTSVNAFVSYPAHRHNDTLTERVTNTNDHITPPAMAEITNTNRTKDCSSKTETSQSRTFRTRTLFVLDESSRTRTQADNTVDNSCLCVCCTS